MADDRRVRCAANAIAWELYANDGRATFTTHNPEGLETLAADMSDDEIETAMRIARRVVRHLDEMENATS